MTLLEALELMKAGLTPEEVLWLEGWQECDARHIYDREWIS